MVYIGLHLFVLSKKTAYPVNYLLEMWFAESHFIINSFQSSLSFCYLSVPDDMVKLDYTSEKYACAYVQYTKRVQISVNVMDSNVFHALIL
jgi:hypothetical protein